LGKVNKVLFFLLWPFGSLLANISKHEKFDQRVLFLTAFIGFFGFSYSIIGDTADIVRIKDLFYKVDSEITLGLSFSEHISRIYVYEDYADPFAPIFAYLTAYLIDDHRFYLLVLGLIYGYFYAYVLIFISTINESRKNHLGPLSAILFLYLILQIPVWQLNGIRFWTGTMFVLFYLIRYTYFGKKLTPILLSPFFHSAFLILAPVIVFFLPLWEKFELRKMQLIILSCLLIAYYGGFRVKAFELDGIAGNSAAIEGKISAYNKTDGDIEEDGPAQVTASWFITLRYQFQEYLRIFMQVEFILVAWFIIGSGMVDPMQKRELQLVLFLGIVGHIFTLHPSPSASRYTVFFSYLSNLFLIRNLIFSRYSELTNLVLLKFRLVRIVFGFMLAFVGVVEIRNGFEYLNYALFISNPLTVYYFGNDTPLIEFYHAIFGKFAG
jgi:hypothetical protein